MPLDFFETPPELIKAGLTYLRDKCFHRDFMPQTILDAGAGTGNWGRAARQVFGAGVEITGIDDFFTNPDPDIYDHWFRQNFLDRPVKPHGEYDLVMSNPPFSLAEHFIRQGIKMATRTGRVMMLLRLGFLASQDRNSGLWQEHPPSEVLVLGERPSFTKTADGQYDGITDPLTDYMLAIWLGDEQRQPITQLKFGFSWAGKIKKLNGRQRQLL